MKYTKIIKAINTSNLSLAEIKEDKKFIQNLSEKIGCSQMSITQVINDLMK